MGIRCIRAGSCEAISLRKHAKQGGDCLKSQYCALHETSIVLAYKDTRPMRDNN